jgi:hypothetical protein
MHNEELHDLGKNLHEREDEKLVKVLAVPVFRFD